MNIIKSKSAEHFENSVCCEGDSFTIGDGAIDGAVIRVTGRYPTQNYLVNDVCKELVYVTSGAGQLLSENDALDFVAGDVVFVDSGELFAWDGTFEGFFVCTPAFYPSQHREVRA